MHSIDITMTLDEYLKQKNFSKFFINHYIIPMAASIWSTSPNMILEMPRYFFISFFKNHGLLKIVDRLNGGLSKTALNSMWKNNCQPKWNTSTQYKN